MTLPDFDQRYLAVRQITHEIVVDGGMECVIFPGWVLPSGLSVRPGRRPVAAGRGLPGYPARHVVDVSGDSASRPHCHSRHRGA